MYSTLIWKSVSDYHYAIQIRSLLTIEPIFECDQVASFDEVASLSARMYSVKLYTTCPRKFHRVLKSLYRLVSWMTNMRLTRAQSLEDADCRSVRNTAT